MNTQTHALHSRTPRQRHMPRQSSGFTLVELVVTMVIAAILAAIAIPAYSNYVRKAHRTEAKSTLLDLASLEERYFSTNNTYTQTSTDLGYTGATPFPVGSGYYNITTLTATAATPPTAQAPAGTPASYAITATAATADQLKDTPCKTFTVSANGTQSSQDASNVDTTATCWR